MLERGKTDIVFEYILNENPMRNDALMAAMPPGSIIINATGMGKDLPGSPITDQGLFPMKRIAWELNYRGELGFMYQAHTQSATRKVHVEDGWLYFLHGLTQCSLKSIIRRSGETGLIGSPLLRERLPNETIYPRA